MAIFTYECKEHGEFRVSLDLRKKEVPCKHDGCESICPPVIKFGGSVRVVDRLDNGAMARRVERLHNIEELMDERNEKSNERTNRRIGAVDDEA